MTILSIDGEDYITNHPVTFNFSQGHTKFCFSFTIRDDTEEEPEERLPPLVILRSSFHQKLKYQLRIMTVLREQVEVLSTNL